MNARVHLGAAAVAVAIILLGRLDAGGASGPAAKHASAPQASKGEAGKIGPDVITADLPATRLWATDETETAYSFATTSCNIGDMDLSWVGGDAGIHPIIAQSMFRLTPDGRFEQIGQSWVKHAFCALQNPLSGCGECAGGGGCLDHLGPGCSDPYTASRNGQQFGLGPKWQIDAHAGSFVFPFSPGEGTEGSFRRRVRVSNDVLGVTGHRYVIEGQYVSADDADYGNQNNNASYRRVIVDENTLSLTMNGPTRRMVPAIHAWQELDPDVTLVDAQVPDEGRFILGYKVTELGDDAWQYEYALYNMNSHRSARGFTLPVGDAVVVSDASFHDVHYHSGDGVVEEGDPPVDYDGTDWPVLHSASELTWETDRFEDNVNANALRWGTLYNFAYTADAPPVEVDVVVTLFRPGGPVTLCIPTMAPGAPADACPADVDDNGAVDFGDVLALLVDWGPCCGCAGDVDGNGIVEFADIIEVLAAWGACR